MSPSPAGRERSGCRSADPQLGQRLRTAIGGRQYAAPRTDYLLTVIVIFISSWSVQMTLYLPGFLKVRV